MTPTELLEHLCELTQAQLDAAIILDGATLAALQPQRSALAHQLHDISWSALTAAERTHARGLARRLAATEERLATVAAMVTGVLDAALDGPPPTYGRSGLFSPR